MDENCAHIIANALNWIGKAIVWAAVIRAFFQKECKWPPARVRG